MSRRAILWAAALLVAGLLLRVLAAQTFWSAFDREFPRVWDVSKSVLSQDGTQYVRQANPDSWSARLFRDWEQKPYYRPPLASYYMSALLPAVNFDRRAASLAQSLLATLAYALVFVVTARRLGVGTAFAALALTLLHPTLVYFDASFEDSALAVACTAATLAALLLAPRNAWASLAGAGTFAGLAVIARPNLAVAWLLWALVVWWRSEATPARTAAAFLLPGLVLTGLASAHNVRVSGAFSFVTETSGENLYWGNGPHPAYRSTLQGMWAIRTVDRGSPGLLLVQDLHRRHPDRTVDAAFAAETRAHVLAHPAAALQNVGAKVVRHLASDEIPRNENFEWMAARRMRLAYPFPPYACLFFFAMVGAWAERRRAPAVVAALLAVWAAAFASEVLYFNAGRYRALAIPFLLPLAVAGVQAAVAAARQRPYARVAAGAVVLGALVLVGRAAVTDTERRRDLSAAAFKAAMLEAYPDDAGRLRLLDETRFRTHLEEAARLDPDNLEAFSMTQKVRLLDGEPEAVAKAVAERRGRCAPDEPLCVAVCDFLDAARSELAAGQPRGPLSDHARLP